MSPSETQKSPSFIPHLNAFRGVAIISIIIGHALSGGFYFVRHESSWTSTSLFSAMAETFGHGGTIYFTLISGILFSLILKSRGWGTFAKSKILYVLLPYIFFSAGYTLYGFRDGGMGFFEGTLVEYMVELGGNLLTGTSFYHMWYIPILILVYLSTPLITPLLHKPKLRILLYLLVFMPLVSSRLWPGFSVTTPLYFIGAYTAGLIIGEHYQLAQSLFYRFRWALLASTVICSAVLIYFYTHSIDKLAFVSARESLFYIQKLCFGVWLLTMLGQIEQKLPKWLHVLADKAFPIYFIHAVIQVAIIASLSTLNLPWESDLMVFAISMAGALGSLLGAAVISIAIGKLLGKRSRLLIGA
ncbi:MAG: hypothetical protein COA42_08295 [Alteromonadaceae bacterium]|nr:MAG: hypothetical protein COA42_08295 [Alteromonadaceae bacterium]